MKLTQTRSKDFAKDVYIIEVPDIDLMSIKFDEMEGLLIDECKMSNKLSDWFLVWEMIARKLEAQAEPISKDEVQKESE